MVAKPESAAGTRLFRLDRNTGIATGFLAVAAVFVWFYWGRSFQIAVALAAAAFGLVYLRYLEIPIVILGFLITSNIANFIPGSTSAYLALTLLVLIVRKFLVGSLKWRWGPHVVAGLIFIAYYQSTGLWVGQTTFYEWDLLYRIVPALIVVGELFSLRRHYIWFFVGIAFGMIFTSVSTIKTAYEFYTGGVADQIAGTVQSIETTRFYGHWPDPNIMSMTLTAFLGGVVALWRSRVHVAVRTVMFLALVLTVAAILMTLSRAGLVGVFIVVVMMLAVERKRWVLLLSVATVVALLLAVLPVDLFSRIDTFLSGTDKSATERMSLILGGWKFFWDNPIFGGGLGHFKSEIVYYILYLKQGVFAHNTMVDLAVDGGIVAVLLFMACIFYAARGLDWKSWHSDPNDYLSMLNAGLRAGLVASVFSMLTVTSYSYVPFWVLMTMCAFFAATARNQTLPRLQVA